LRGFAVLGRGRACGAYVNAVAADQAVGYAQQVMDSAAEVAAQLAQRMQQAGNFSKLDYAREQAFYAEAVAQLAKSRQQAVSAREKLTRSMGLWGSAIQYRLPERLPDLPKSRPELTDLESFAMQNRVDIQAAKMQTHFGRKGEIHARRNLQSTGGMVSSGDLRAGARIRLRTRQARKRRARDRQYR
jgi:hypothetical protein